VADPPRIAIDIALLLPDSLGRSLTALNRTLRPPPEGFHFDATHLPHLTLVQQFAKQQDLEAVASVVGDVARHEAPLVLATTRITHGHVSSTLGVELTDQLAALHRRLIERLEPFRDGADEDDQYDAFWTDGDEPRPADIEWVATFREQSALQRFYPHITIGMGVLATPMNPTSFVVTRLAMCQLGRFCTCRRVLRGWTLTASER
jgi:hypothetical protein